MSLYVGDVKVAGAGMPGEGSEGGSLPPGGTTGQVLKKASATDGDAVWGAQATAGTAAPSGGADGDIYFRYA